MMVGGIRTVSIAAALVRLDTRISQLPDADLRRGLIWTRDQGWVDEKTKALLGEALANLPPAAGAEKVGT